MLSLTGLAIIVGTIVLVQNLSLKPPHTHASIPPQEKPALPLPSIPSIAVLPFTNLSGDPQQEYFSDGITDQLINDLSRLPGLFVIARNSSFAYKGKAIKEHEIGKELGVKYVLEGSVQKAADRVRIGVELVDASTGTEDVDAALRPAAQGHFCGAGRDRRQGGDDARPDVQAGRDESSPLRKMRPTDNLEAYDDFLRAAGYFWRSRRTTTRGRGSGSRKPSRWTRNLPMLTAFLGGAIGWMCCTNGARILGRTWNVPPKWRRRRWPWMTPIAMPSRS